MRFAPGERVARACIWREQPRRYASAKQELMVHIFFADWSPRAAEWNAPTEEEKVADALWHLSAPTEEELRAWSGYGPRGERQGVEFSGRPKALCGSRDEQQDMGSLSRDTLASFCNTCRRKAGLSPRKGRAVRGALDILKGSHQL